MSLQQLLFYRPDFQLSGLTDSKKLSEKKRDLFYQKITEQCDWSVGEASSIEIDQINILQATMLAMKRAIINLQEELFQSTEVKLFLM